MLMIAPSVRAACSKCPAINGSYNCRAVVETVARCSRCLWKRVTERAVLKVLKSVRSVFSETHSIAASVVTS